MAARPCCTWDGLPAAGARGPSEKPALPGELCRVPFSFPVPLQPGADLPQRSCWSGRTSQDGRSPSDRKRDVPVSPPCACSPTRCTGRGSPEKQSQEDAHLPPEGNLLHSIGSRDHGALDTPSQALPEITSQQRRGRPMAQSTGHLQRTVTAVKSRDQLLVSASTTSPSHASAGPSQGHLTRTRDTEAPEGTL